jgi:tetratricopeptide (TPR) repeat protein
MREELMASMIVFLLRACILFFGVTAWAQDTREKENLPDVPDAILKGPVRSVTGDADFRELKSHLDAQHWREAKWLAEQLAARHPQEPFPHFCLGYVLLRQHDNLSAIRSLRKAERLGWKDAALPKTLGLAYYTINQFLLFKQQMQKGIEAAPNDPWPHYYLGLYEATVTEHFSEALNHFDKALTLQPDDPKILYYRGFCHEMLDQRGLARKDYEVAIQRLSHFEALFSLPYQGLARLLSTTDHAEALRYAQLAVEKESGVANNHLILAKICEELGKLPEAIEALKAAARTDPTLATPHYQWYRLLSRQGDQERASNELAEFQKLKALYGS